MRQDILRGILPAVIALAFSGSPALAQKARSRPPHKAVAKAARTYTTQELAAKALPLVVTLTVKDVNDKVISTGSGFIVARTWIMTALHVISGDGAKKITANYSDGRSVQGVAFVTDSEHDLALLVLNGRTEMSRLPWADTNDIRVGSRAVVVSSPRGLGGSVTEGIVSAVRNYHGSKVLQTTAPVSPGSSGGLLLNDKAEVIGIVSFLIRDSQNLNFAYAAGYAKRLCESVAGASDKDFDVFERIIAQNGYFFVDLGVAVPTKTAPVKTAQSVPSPVQHTGPAPKEGTYEYYLARGRELWRQKKEDESADNLRMAVQLQPDKSEGHHMLAEVLYYSKKYMEASVEYTKAASIMNTYEDYESAGSCYSMSDQPVAAIESFQKAKKLIMDSNYLDTDKSYEKAASLARLLSSMAICYKEIKDYESEEQCYIQGSSSQEYSYLMWKASKDYNKEVEKFERDDVADIYYSLGTYYLEREQFQKAVGSFSKSLEYKAEGNLYRVSYGEALYKLGEKVRGRLEWYKVKAGNDTLAVKIAEDNLKLYPP